MKSPQFLIATLCSALVVGGAVFIALVLLRLRGKAVAEPEYIVLPPTPPETEAAQPRERELQSV